MSEEDQSVERFTAHIEALQTSLAKVSGGMGVLADSAVRQGQDTENLAAHILAIETLLTVILRQIPIDIAEVRDEASRRSMNSDGSRDGGQATVIGLCEDILRQADD